MALPRYAVHASSLLALAGLLSLLLADSAEDACSTTKFDRTFDVTSTCKGESVARIRIISDLYAPVGTERASFAPSSVNVLSGNIDIQGGDVVGSCGDEDEPFTMTGIALTVAATAEDPAGGTGSERAECVVDFSLDFGRDVPCKSPDVPIVECSLKLTAVP